MTIEYKVVSSSRPDRFEETVTDLLNEGWELQGPPFISQIGAMTQALTRSDTKQLHKISKKSNASVSK
tara:strand:- start:3274 stop:3477 length:204 start_codon:yes stop_codon:yes gene_type:complete